MSKGNFAKHIPNIFTFANMLLGMLSVLLLVQIEHINIAVIVPIMILFGGVADFFDGFLARKLNSVTDFGKQLDSFADILTFGVAPISLMNYLTVCNYPIPILIASMIYMTSGAYRLARFNLSDFKSHFMGLPITAAGIILTAYCVVYPFWAEQSQPFICTVATTSLIILLSFLMISKKKVRRII